MARAAASSVLLMVLFLVAGTSAAAAVSGDGTIRLPSDDFRGSVADLVTAMASAKQSDEERPWECCDKIVCAKTWPPICRCSDVLDQCSDACKMCEEVEDDASRKICRDVYRGTDPVPRCHEDLGNGRAGTERMAVVTKEGQERPWECCDKPVRAPTTEGTLWYCMDKFEKCTCESCLKLEDDSHRYYYLDEYEGSEPGPTCSHHE